MGLLRDCAIGNRVIEIRQRLSYDVLREDIREVYRNLKTELCPNLLKKELFRCELDIKPNILSLVDRNEKEVVQTYLTFS